VFREMVAFESKFRSAFGYSIPSSDSSNMSVETVTKKPGDLDDGINPDGKETNEIDGAQCEANR